MCQVPLLWLLQFWQKVDIEQVSTHGVNITKVGRLDQLGENTVSCKVCESAQPQTTDSIYSFKSQ